MSQRIENRPHIETMRDRRMIYPATTSWSENPAKATPCSEYDELNRTAVKPAQSARVRRLTDTLRTRLLDQDCELCGSTRFGHHRWSQGIGDLCGSGRESRRTVAARRERDAPDRQSQVPPIPWHGSPF
jgi:hypothetical protein